MFEDLERTKAENEYLKKSFPLALERSKRFKKRKVVKELREKYKFSLLLDIAGLSKKAYYYAIKHCEGKNKKRQMVIYHYSTICY